MSGCYVRAVLISYSSEEMISIDRNEDVKTAIPGEAKKDIGIIDHVIASLEDDKAEEIVRIDLRSRSAIADFMVVASGRSSRQVVSIAEKLVERIKPKIDIPVRIEGKDAGDWVLIDLGDVVVHVFRPEVREFYQLEKMWLDVPQMQPEASPS